MTKFVVAIAIAAGLASPVMAQTAATNNMDILRQKIKADKKLLIAQNLQLTDAEGTAFWPVYEAYQKDLQQINQRLGAMVVAYAGAYKKGPIADDVAKKLLDEAVAIDGAEATLKGALVAKVLGALPATKAARYLQIESKIRALVRYELAEGIPLVQ
jgi:hypothetical protein